MKSTRFGIVGLGKIANRLAADIALVPGAELTGIASRDRQKAQIFADRYKVGKVFDSYETLMASADIDLVYIATPHVFHFAQAMAAVKQQKHVLCEKPMCMNLQQTATLVQAARKANVFLMEAMWTRFFPAVQQALTWIDQGKIGDIRHVSADFGFLPPVNLDGRIYNPALGGGAQLDVGVYPLFLSVLLLGRPSSVKAITTPVVTGVDGMTSVLMNYEQRAQAYFMSTFLTDTPKQAVISGTRGEITLHTPWHKARQVSLRTFDGTIEGHVEKFDFAYAGTGLEFEIEQVVRCLREGKTESSLMPLSLSLLMAEVADEILAQGGITYSFASV